MKNIYVCVKHVPDSSANIHIIDDRQIKENVDFLLNPYDEHALTEARKIKKQYDGAQIIAICLGPRDATKTVRAAMAMGADKGILIKTSEKMDSNTIAKALKACMDRFEPADLIFTGKESIDVEGMQTMFRIGELYGIPVANNVVKLTVMDEKVVVDTEFSGGICDTYELSTPCVIGAGRGLNTPRYPTFEDVITSKRKPVDQLDLTTLLPEAPISSTQIIHLAHLTQNRTPKQITGDSQAIAQRIVNILKQEAKVL